MKKRLFSILISICMVFTMIPMAGGAVFAATATSVTIGGVELNAETPYYHNGTDGEVQLIILPPDRAQYLSLKAEH